MNWQNIYNRSKAKYGFIYSVRRHFDLYILLILPLVVIIIFKYFPMYGIIMAFQDFNIVDGYWGSEFVGLKHFLNFFKDPFFFRLVRNTVLLGTYNLLWRFWPPVLLALLLNELYNLRFKKIVQSISYLPHFISTVVIVGMFMKMLSHQGIVNNIIAFFGHERINFFLEPRFFRTIYISSGMWQGIGWGSILYLATLAGINPALYESAIIDGANRLQRALSITLPSITPTVVILFILNVSEVVEIGFQKVFLLYNPAIYETADVISTYIYRRGILGGQFSYTAAIGLFNTVIALILTFVTNRIAKRVSGTSLW